MSGSPSATTPSGLNFTGVPTAARFASYGTSPSPRAQQSSSLSPVTALAALQHGSELNYEEAANDWQVYSSHVTVQAVSVEEAEARGSGAAAAAAPVALTPRSARRTAQWEVAIGAAGDGPDQDSAAVGTDEEDEEGLELAQLLASTTDLLLTSPPLSLVSSETQRLVTASSSAPGDPSTSRGDQVDTGRCPPVDPGTAYQDAVNALVRAGDALTTHQRAMQHRLASEIGARARLEVELTAVTNELADLRAAKVMQLQSTPAVHVDSALAAALAGDVELLSRHRPEALSSLQAQLNAARDAVTDALLAARVAERMSLAESCAICFDKPLDIALMPCGHRACADCAPKLTLCHVCRAPVSSRVRVY
jgi:hypothetical protein